MQLLPRELVQSGTVRKAREAYLIERDQTLQYVPLVLAFCV